MQIRFEMLVELTVELEGHSGLDLPLKSSFWLFFFFFFFLPGMQGLTCVEVYFKFKLVALDQDKYLLPPAANSPGL